MKLGVKCVLDLLSDEVLAGAGEFSNKHLALTDENRRNKALADGRREAMTALGDGIVAFVNGVKVPRFGSVDDVQARVRSNVSGFAELVVQELSRARTELDLAFSDGRAAIAIHFAEQDQAVVDACQSALVDAWRQVLDGAGGYSDDEVVAYACRIEVEVNDMDRQIRELTSQESSLRTVAKMGSAGLRGSMAD